MKYNSPIFNASIMKKISEVNQEAPDNSPINIAKSYFVSAIHNEAEKGKTELVVPGRKILSLSSDEWNEFVKWFEEKGFTVLLEPNKLVISWV